MSGEQLAAPELAAIDVKGITRGSFLVRGTMAAGAVYGGGMVSPFVRRALAQGGDVEILNFALTLEHLESEFYERALREVGDLDGDVKELVQEIQSNEAEHVDALSKAVRDAGGTPAKPPQVDFGNAFASQDAFLKLAGTFESVGVGAYNGAAPAIRSKDVLASAGSIVQVEGRHVALINLKRDAPITPDGAFSKPLTMKETLKAVEPFIGNGS